MSICNVTHTSFIESRLVAHMYSEYLNAIDYILYYGQNNHVIIDGATIHMVVNAFRKQNTERNWNKVLKHVESLYEYCVEYELTADCDDDELLEYIESLKLVLDPSVSYEYACYCVNQLNMKG